MCWHCREYDRFRDGTYKKVPWVGEPWANKSEVSYHYVHVSQQDPSLVAYTVSEEHGEADRQTRIAPGRYLTRFFGDVLTQKDIQYWCGRFKGEHQDEITLKFASEPDDIAWVYEHGPSSCMAGSADGFNADGCHPASVYGAGDLAVAYILNDGRVTARAICWPAKNIYGRLYGDAHTLRTKLEAVGYRRGEEGEFDGARLLRIECYDGGFVCPYLDIGSKRRVDDNGDYLIVGSGYIRADSPDGRAGGGVTCPHCGEYYDPDDAVYVQDVEETWCEWCAEDTSRCHVCGDTCTDESMSLVSNDNLVCEDCLDQYYSLCDVCDQYHHYRDEPCEREEVEVEEVEEEEEEVVVDRGTLPNNQATFLLFDHALAVHEPTVLSRE